jgi:DTW domain-containing protein
VRHTSSGDRCSRCLVKQVLCVCSFVEPIHSTHACTLVLHDLEQQKSTNSGRFLPLVLSRASVIPYGARTSLSTVAPETWAPAGTRPVLLYPREGARSIESFNTFANDGVRTCVIVLDGTWHQANKARQHIARLGIPFARLPEPQRPSEYRLRRGHFADSLSTLEAAARAMRLLEGEPHGAAVEDALLRPFRVMVDRLLWLRGELGNDEVFGGIPSGIARHDINGIDARRRAVR